MADKKMTLKRIAERLDSIEATQPNGELKRIESMVKNQGEMLSEMHYKIMDPETGLIVQTNKNTEFRETCLPERELLIDQFKGVLRWKKAIEWGIGIIFVAVIGAIIKIIIT